MATRCGLLELNSPHYFLRVEVLFLPHWRPLDKLDMVALIPEGFGFFGCYLIKLRMTSIKVLHRLVPPLWGLYFSR